MLRASASAVERMRKPTALLTIIAAAFGIMMMLVAYVALGARIAEPISEMFPFLAYEYGYGKNVVNVTLVDIRAWDTLGELSVVQVEDVIGEGLHEFLTRFINRNAALGQSVADGYLFGPQ